MQTLSYHIDAAGQGRRLDIFLAEAQSEVSRSRIKKLIEEQRVTVNGSAVSAHYKLKSGDRVELCVPAPAPMDALAEPIALNIVYEDDCMLAVDKPAGLVVHPAPGHQTGTLVNALLHHCSYLAGIGGVQRPGIVHRLDKDTSGLVMVAKTDAAHQSLTRQFKDRTLTKVYLALVKGKVASDNGIIDSPIGRHKIHRKKMTSGAPHGREAKTRYEVIQRFGHFTYLRLYPKTGRTHQIRVHLASIKHPVLGDTLYGGSLDPKYPGLSRQALHAHRLELLHPESGQPLVLESPLPPDMAAYLKTYSPDGF